MKYKKKIPIDQSIRFLEYKIERLEHQYQEHAKNFAQMVSVGVALTAVGALDTIRSLNFLYTDIAAHRDALRTMKLEF